MGQMGRFGRTKITLLASVLLVAGGTAAEGTDAQHKAARGVPAVSSAPPSHAPARADKARGWDSSHMQSGYRSLTAEPLEAPKMLGKGRYEVVRGDAAATPGYVPPSTLPTYTQRTWESGVYEGPGKRSRLGHGPRAGREGSAQRDLSGTRHRGKPPGLTSSNRGRRYRNQ